jgi:hypothetical protein
MNVTHEICGSILYLSVPRKGLTKKKALALLQKEAHLAGATPAEKILDGGTLGESDGPTLYVMKAALVPHCRHCGSTTKVNADGCCVACQLKEAKAA